MERSRTGTHANYPLAGNPQRSIGERKTVVGYSEETSATERAAPPGSISHSSAFNRCLTFMLTLRYETKGGNDD